MGVLRAVTRRNHAIRRDFEKIRHDIASNTQEPMHTNANADYSGPPADVVRGANAKGRTNSVRARGRNSSQFSRSPRRRERGGGEPQPRRPGPPPSFGSRVRCEGPQTLFILASLLAAVLMGYVAPSSATDRFQVCPGAPTDFRVWPFLGVGG